MTVDLEHLRSWIGRTETLHDTATLAPLRALSATLDREAADIAPGWALPPCWHWLYFLPMHRQSELGPDGHAQRGGFLPPVPLPRRMWAGSRLDFLAPLRAGQAIERHSRIADVRLKTGRQGALVFVHVHHDIHAEGAHVIHEEHDIVYRDLAPANSPASAAGADATSASAGATAAATPALPEADWRRPVRPDDVLLFRYSALTFNGHRIHYDRRYVTEVEGYPGLIVHGPLIATLLLDLLRQALPQATVRHFAFKALQPIFDTAPFEVCGRREGAHGVKLWAITPTGQMAMDAQATLA